MICSKNKFSEIYQYSKSKFVSSVRNISAVGVRSVRNITTVKLYNLHKCIGGAQGKNLGITLYVKSQ